MGKSKSWQIMWMCVFHDLIHAQFWFQFVLITTLFWIGHIDFTLIVHICEFILVTSLFFLFKTRECASIFTSLKTWDLQKKIPLIPFDKAKVASTRFIVVCNNHPIPMLNGYLNGTKVYTLVFYQEIDQSTNITLL